MNKRCLALTPEQYEECVKLLRSGFKLSGVFVKPNPRIATIAVLQGSLGLRLGDVLQLTMDSFVRDGDHYRLNIVEQKTKKARNFAVPQEIYGFVQDYAIDNQIKNREVKLFQISARQVERHLNKTFERMGLPLRNYGSHSFRKLWATRIYKDNGYDIELTRIVLQHSNVSVTQRYIGIEQQTIQEALQKTASYLV